MTTEINTETATEWLKNRYKNVPGIWEQFDLEDAAESLAESALSFNIDSYDDLPVLDIMCIMSDARM